MNDFYKNAKILDRLEDLSNPTSDNRAQLLDIISGDTELAIYFYDGNTNAKWLKLLKEAGEFESLKDREGEADRCQGIKALYLRKVAEQKPKEVLEVFTSIGKLHIFVQSDFLSALLKMPEDIAVKGVPDVLGYLKRKEPHNWYLDGDAAAELMIKLAEKHPNEAFALAESLLDVWKPEGDDKSIFNDITAKFAVYEYNELIFKYYKELWNIDIGRATKLIVQIFEKYLGEVHKNKDYEASSLFYITLERLDQIDRIDRDIIAILVNGICEAGKAVIERQPEKISELLDYLESLNKHIFERIEMYLLRFVPAGTQQKRISNIIKNKKFLETSGFEYEYRFLLRDKFEDIDQDARKVFEDWVKAKNLTDENKERIREWFKEREDREATEKDFETIENSDKAKALYLVREKFPELYKECQLKSGASDIELAPEPRLSEGRWISPTEGTPISPEEMNKLQPSEVIEYIISEKWRGKKQTNIFHTPEEGLAGTFKINVQGRANDYAALEASELIKLKPEFLSQYFYGIENALREKKVESASLVKVLGQAINVVKEKESSKEYRGSFQAILEIIREIFDNEALKEAIAKANSELVWGIIEPLTKYDYNPDVIVGDDTEPHTECINSVQGKAFELVVRFGLICKKDNLRNYEKTWSGKVQKVLTYIVDKVKTAKTMCVFGVWFPQLHWLEEKWICENLEEILDNKNDEMWGAVWGSYMSWSRPYKKVFEFLAEQGKYKHAIEKIGSTTKYRHSKDPEEGLVEHLMIAFFNGWIEFEGDLLKQFLEKAPEKLRGQAAQFLTTGFGPLSEKPDKETSKRLKQYCKMRLLEIRKDPANNIKETVEFVGWIKDTPFEKKETFDLLYKTLGLTNGKLGKGRSVCDFMKSVYDYDFVKDYELIALQCMNKAMNDEHMAMYFSQYEEKATGFMESVVKLPDDYPDVQEIRREAIKLADAFGRKHVYQLRPFYEELTKKV